MTKPEIITTGLNLLVEQMKFEVLDGTSTSDVTLKFSFISKVYTKTMPFKDSLDENKVKRNWIELFHLFEKDFPVGNVPAETNQPKEGDMSKEESIAKFRSTVEAQETAALGQIFDDGKAEGGAGFTKEDVDKAVKDALAALPPDTTPFDQAYVSEAVSKAVAEALAALPADQTPFSKEDLDKAVADAVAAIPKSNEEMVKQLGELKTENALLKQAIQAEIDDSKVDTSRLETVLAPVLTPEPTPEVTV